MKNLRVLAPSNVANLSVVFTGPSEGGYGLLAWDRAGRSDEVHGQIGDVVEILGVTIKLVSVDIMENTEGIEDGGDSSNITIEVLGIDEAFGTEIGDNRTREMTENTSAQAGEYWLSIGDLKPETFALFAKAPTGESQFETEVREGDMVKLFDLEVRVTKYVRKNPEADGLTTVEVEIL